MWRSYGGRSEVLYTELLVFGICGLAGVFIDLDHLVTIHGKGRWAHKPLLVGCCIVFGILGTYLGRLLVG